MPIYVRLVRQCKPIWDHLIRMHVLASSTFWPQDGSVASVGKNLLSICEFTHTVDTFFFIWLTNQNSSSGILIRVKCIIYSNFDECVYKS